MDMQRYQRMGHTASPHVVRLERKRPVVGGTRPMPDVIVLTTPNPLHAGAVSAPFGERFVASLLILLMTLLPLSPILAAEELDGIAPVTDSQELSGDEFDVSIVEAEDAPSELEDAIAEEVAPEDDQADVDEPDTSVAEASEEETENVEVSVEQADVFDPSRLPSVDNPAPEGWYEDDGIGEVISGNDIPTEDAEIVEGDTDEISEDAMRDQIYQEVLQELQSEIAAFIEAKQKHREGCLEYEDGSYFCLNPDREEHGITSTDAGGTGTVYAQADPIEGDGEIYYLPQGATDPVRITDDIYDDALPQLGLDGSGIVWQSLVNDRWQVKYYNFSTGLIEQLTSSLHNSMHPTLSGGYVVWQAWPKDNWEIVLARHQAGGWSVEKITETVAHDMFPKVAGGYVTWQSREGDSWQVYAYDIAQGLTTKLSTGAEKHENPRVALIWEATQDDGSRRILSFDLTSGEVAPIGSRPANPEPEELPRPPLTDEDVIVETRAGEKEEEGGTTPDPEPEE